VNGRVGIGKEGTLEEAACLIVVGATGTFVGEFAEGMDPK